MQAAQGEGGRAPAARSTPSPTKIRGLEQQVGDVSERLAPLEHELELRELKLNRLNALFQVQTERLAFLRAEYRTALDRLNRRLVAAYEADTPDELVVPALLAQLLATSSTGSTTSGWSPRRDRQIADDGRRRRGTRSRPPARTRSRARTRCSSQAKIVAVRVHQVRVLRDELVASKGQLDEAREPQEGRPRLAAARRSGRTPRRSTRLQQVSAELAAKIRAAQSHSTVAARRRRPRASSGR